MNVYSVTFTAKNDKDAWAEPVFMIGETMEDVFKAISDADIDWSRVVEINRHGELIG